LLSSLAFAVGFVPYVVGGTLLSGRQSDPAT
jgi:hypothetical protein